MKRGGNLGDEIGIIVGETSAHEFKFLMADEASRGSYVKVREGSKDWIFAQVVEVTRSNVAYSISTIDEEKLEAKERVLGLARVIGVASGGRLAMPTNPPRPGDPVFRADGPLIEMALGLSKGNLYIGLLEGHDLKVKLDADSFVQKHCSILAKTGSGKSYTAAVVLEELLEKGIMREFRPEVVTTCQRGASAYSGYPFIVEAAIAYGGDIPVTPTDELLVFRYANKIPLLYDLHSDVTMKVIKNISWQRYRLDLATMPLAFFIHICATKVPYKTVGKEYIADRPEVEYEIEWALKTCARGLRTHIAKKDRASIMQRRLTVFEKYLPMISQFSTELAGAEKQPNVEKVLKRLQAHAKEIERGSAVQAS